MFENKNALASVNYLFLVINDEYSFSSYQYPSMVKLGEMVGNVIDHFK